MSVICDVKVTQGKGNSKFVNFQQKVRMRSKEGGSAEEIRNRGTKEMTGLCHERRGEALSRTLLHIFERSPVLVNPG